MWIKKNKPSTINSVHLTLTRTKPSLTTITSQLYTMHWIPCKTTLHTNKQKNSIKKIWSPTNEMAFSFAAYSRSIYIFFFARISCNSITNSNVLLVRFFFVAFVVVVFFCLMCVISLHLFIYFVIYRDWCIRKLMERTTRKKNWS